MTCFLAVDPGLTGAMAALCTRRGFLALADLPICDNGHAGGSMRNWTDPAALRAILRDWQAVNDMSGEGLRCFLERPIPMPSLPAQTIASQFDTLGVLRAVLPFPVMVTPQEWKKFYRLSKDKSASLDMARRLYPVAAPFLKRGKDHNRAEALLIAHWALETQA